MATLAGTSGFSYKDWKGSFYPQDLKAEDMLGYYSGQLPAVEINNTFYRMPRTALLESWANQVPGPFRFAIKASRRITHVKRLKGAFDETQYLLQTLTALGERLGAILFQLPPFLRKDVDTLSAFLQLLPEGTPAAFEFRHASWQDEDVFEALRAHNAALCLADTDEAEPTVVSTADWGYLRLRRTEYDDERLERWSKVVAAQGWRDTLAFFKHEDAGPALARRFQELADSAVSDL